MMTPEAREKARVRKYLTKLGAYQFWPTQRGFGKQAIDCIACIHGTYWGIEVKAPGEEPTARQWKILDDIEAAGGLNVWGPAAVIIEYIEDWHKVRG